MAKGKPGAGEFAQKIARLIEEKGWNQEDFARISSLNRHTVRQIMHGTPRRLRNATVSQCADALGLTVSDLRTLPLDRLLVRMHGKGLADEETLKTLLESATLPEFVSWLERNPDRVSQLQTDEIEELLELQAPDGPMERLGVEHVVDLIERRRMLLAQVRVIAGSEYFGLLEQFVGLIYDKLNRTKEKQERGRV